MRLPAHLTELHQRTQENLVAFLQAEVDLASAMVGIMNTTKNEDHRQRLLEAIQTTVNTVRYFEHRIENAAVRERLLATAAEVEKAISKGHDRHRTVEKW